VHISWTDVFEYENIHTVWLTRKITFSISSSSIHDLIHIQFAKNCFLTWTTFNEHTHSSLDFKLSIIAMIFFSVHNYLTNCGLATILSSNTQYTETSHSYNEQTHIQFSWSSIRVFWWNPLLTMLQKKVIGQFKVFKNDEYNVQISQWIKPIFRRIRWTYTKWFVPCLIIFVRCTRITSDFTSKRWFSFNSN